MPPTYSVGERRKYVEQNLNTLYEFDNYERTTDSWSYRQIASDVGRHFARKPVSPATIKTDLDTIISQHREKVKDKKGLLNPKDFRVWRANYFKDPGTGKPYETPDHQYHWFRIIMALALKTAVPADTLEYLELPETLSDDILSLKKLLTLILLAPPRHGKTELALHAIIWLICYNPNVRIIYCSGITTTSQDNMSLVQQELEFNEKLVSDYGPFKSDSVKWNQRQFTVSTRTIAAKTATMLPIGVGSNPLSKDADLIIVDDPQDLDRAESETVTARDYRWFTTQLMSRREPQTPVIGLGSHLPTLFGDLWSQIEENQEELAKGNDNQVLIIKKVRAHDYNLCDTINDVDADGKPQHSICVLWPSLRPYWFLEAQRAMIGDDVLFEAVYNQELLEGALRYFPKETVRGEYIYPQEYYDGKGHYSDLDLSTVEPGILDTTRSWRTIPRCCNSESLLVALGVDPGGSDAKTASESAFFLAGVCPICGRIYVIDYEHVRQSPELNPHTIIKFAESYSELQRCRVEVNAYQKALARDQLLQASQTKYRFIVEEWNTDERKNDPKIGIPVLSRHMKNGKFSVPYKTEIDRDIAEHFLRQLVRWPKRPNDVVMACWLCELSLAQMYEEAQYAVPEYGDNWSRVPEYLQEQVYEVDLADVME